MRTIFALLLLALAQTCAATSVGTFYCEDCLMDGPKGSLPDGSTEEFIKTIVNQYTDGSWQDKDFKFKNVTICNDSICVLYQYTGNGNLVKVTQNPNTGNNTYKNRNRGGGGNSGSNGNNSGGGGSTGGGGWGNSCYVATTFDPIFGYQRSIECP